MALPVWWRCSGNTLSSSPWREPRRQRGKESNTKIRQIDKQTEMVASNAKINIIQSSYICGKGPRVCVCVFFPWLFICTVYVFDDVCLCCYLYMYTVWGCVDVCWFICIFKNPKHVWSWMLSSSVSLLEPHTAFLCRWAGGPVWASDSQAHYEALIIMEVEAKECD